MILELGAQASAEMITLLSISVNMIARIMTQIIESLDIFDNSAGSLSKSQKFIQLSFHKPFRNMMGSECLLELIPGDNMII